MIVDQDTLNGWRALAERIKQTVMSAQIARRETQTQTLQEAARLAAQLETRLGQAGADRPGLLPVPAHDVPLELMNTPANRRYAQKLRDAWEAGLEVDRERYGPTIGTDGCAQVIEMVLADVEQECFGAVGAGRE